MAGARLDRLRLPRIPEQPVEGPSGCLVAAIAGRSNEALHRFERYRPNFDFLTRPGLEDFLAIDAREKRGVVGKYAPTTKDVRDQIIRE